MQKVLVIGNGGAGKSVFSRRLAERTGLPLIHLDREYWKEGWVESGPEEWEEKVKRLIRAPRWIMDGNYGGTFHLRFPAADTIIFLHSSRWRSLFNVFKRVVQYRGRTRPDMAPGCPEQADREFIRYVYRYNITRRPQILARLNELRAEKNIIELDSYRERETFLANLP